MKKKPQSALTPLHQAVLENDVETIRRLRKDPFAVQATDNRGFTALELAQLLDKRECTSLLYPQAEESFRVLKKGDTDVSTLTKEEFEKFFAIRFLSHPKFTSKTQLDEVIQNCPWTLKSSCLGKENRALTTEYQRELATGFTVDVTVRWIDDIFGYGLFSAQDLAPFSYVGEYTGCVRRLYRLHPDHNGYCFHYPTRFWSWKYYIIDGLKEGNLLRFINHSDTPNLDPLCLVDRGLLHLVFRTNRLVRKGEQLTFNYGTDYWRRREKVSFKTVD